MNPEKRFLQNQIARAAAVHKHTKVNDTIAFWREFRGKLALWNNLVDQHNIECRTATDRQRALHELEILQQELNIMRKDALDELELPVADLRLLHNEFAYCAQRLQNGRNVVCPTTRFVFARYRAAWKERTTMSSHENSSENQRGIKSTSVVPLGRTVQDLEHALVVEQMDGSVSVTFVGGDVDILKLESLASMSLVLQNLRHCELFINSRYQLLHLMNLVSCKVTCSLRIDGAIHITSCTDTIISGSCHQLRIHDSKGLLCHITAGSGPILEDSSRITFYAAPGDNMICETKDFNWFRSEPSPNFVVVEEEVSMAQTEKEEMQVQNSAVPQIENSLKGTSCDEEHDDEL